MLNFIKVDEETLIHGTKYKIIVVMFHANIYTKTYISIFDEYDVNGHDIEWFLWGETTLIIEHYNPYTKEIIYDKNTSMPKYIFNDKQRDIYKLVLSKEKIQYAMELRAINKILQNIIGDPKFSY